MSKFNLLQSHINTVKLYGIYGNPVDLIILELLKRGSLQNYLRSNSKNISLRDQIHWCYDIASGLAYLADEGVIHRDIAARNILLRWLKIIFCKVLFLLFLFLPYVRSHCSLFYFHDFSFVDDFFDFSCC